MLLLLVGILSGYKIYSNKTTQEEVFGDIPLLYTQDCMPRYLAEAGVPSECFYHANTGNVDYCRKDHIKIITDYYEHGGQENDKYKDTPEFCAE